MDEETPILEKIYMVHTHDTTQCLEDDAYVGHLVPPTSTTPTSKECDYKGNNIGVGDAMTPFLDNDAYVVTTLSTNCSFPRFVDNQDKILNMFCAQGLQYSPINAAKMLNDCSFKCLVCNNVDMFENEKAPIALSNNKDFAFAHDKHVPTYTLHTHHGYYNILLDANGDVPTKRCIMMDDVFIYHAHTLFFYLLCV
jgi:hypothetical protein